MEWFGVEVADILSADWLALPEACRAHWLSLHAYCTLHENGGVLKGARKWRDREWRFAAGMLRRSADAMAARGLLLSGETAASIQPGCGEDDYVLANYDSEGERKTQHNSRVRSKVAKGRWEKHANARANADANGAVCNARDETQRDTTRQDIKKRPTRAAPEVSADAREVGFYLLEAIRSHKPDASDGVESWAKDIDKAIRIDKRTPARLKAAIDYAHRSRETFWRGNLLSGASLRKHCERLEIHASGAEVTPIRDIRVGHVAVTGEEKYAGGDVKI